MVGDSEPEGGCYTNHCHCHAVQAEYLLHDGMFFWDFEGTEADAIHSVGGQGAAEWEFLSLGFDRGLRVRRVKPKKQYLAAQSL